MVASIVMFVVAIAVVLLVLKILGKSLKFLMGVLINAAVGFLVLFVLNWLGVGVTITWLSALIVGLLGVPGLIIVLILQLGLGMTL